ncbi:hypothetical protein [Streptomyces sp. NPDC088785]|uniref:hypothetical protein n=1 Tax=Streptomyces sp. NPDC088785 TaxID=3365897 RepID=UPI0037F888E6
MPRTAWWGFVSWTGVGALAALGLLTLFTIGVWLTPVAVAAAVLAATRRGWSAGLPGLVSGLGVPLFYVAYLNRAGPGTVCTSTASGGSCVEEFDPRWWIAAGVLLLLAGAALFVVRGRRPGPGAAAGAVR